MDEARTKQLREEEADLIVQLSERVEGFLKLLSKIAAERDGLEREVERLKVENIYLRQFSNSGKVAAIADQINAEQTAEVERLREALERALYIAEHLHQMVPQSVWRAHGGDDMQGHYEGDYHAEQVAEEIKALSSATTDEELASSAPSTLGYRASGDAEPA